MGYLLSLVYAVLAILETEACWQFILERATKKSGPTASATKCRHAARQRRKLPVNYREYRLKVRFSVVR